MKQTKEQRVEEMTPNGVKPALLDMIAEYVYQEADGSEGKPPSVVYEQTYKDLSKKVEKLLHILTLKN